MNKTDPPFESTLWTVDSVAHYLQVSRKTVFNLRKRGLPFIQLGGAVRFDPVRVKDYLSQTENLAGHQAWRLANRHKGDGQ
jgi:excisionase family DNA binding protein